MARNTPRFECPIRWMTYVDRSKDLPKITAF